MKIFQNNSRKAVNLNSVHSSQSLISNLKLAYFEKYNNNNNNKNNKGHPVPPTP